MLIFVCLFVNLFTEWSSFSQSSVFYMAYCALHFIACFFLSLLLQSLALVIAAISSAIFYCLFLLWFASFFASDIISLEFDCCQTHTHYLVLCVTGVITALAFLALWLSCFHLTNKPHHLKQG